MKASRFGILGGILALLIGLGGVTLPVQAGEIPQNGSFYLYFPLVMASSPAPEAIVIDHRHTDISQIPDYWIAQAKTLVVHYAHTSHGGQVLSGLNWLEAQEPISYNVDIEANGTVVLPDDVSALRIYDGNNYPGDTYITPEQYWESDDGMNHTRSVVDTGWFDFSLWTWCGQMGYYDDAPVQTYMDMMDGFETEYSKMRFIFYTGHTDGTTPESDSKLWRHNNMVRQHVADNRQVLFDFADIESFDPDGNFYPSVSDSCEWCSGWCDAHPQAFECQSLPSCSHSHGLQCTLKGQAFWWLMARLAGWDGTPSP